MPDAPRRQTPGGCFHDSAELRAALTITLGALTHELRTPLGTLYNELAILRHTTETPEVEPRAERAAALLQKTIDSWSASQFSSAAIPLSSVLKHFIEAGYDAPLPTSEISICGVADRFAEHLSHLASYFSTARTIGLQYESDRVDLIVDHTRASARGTMLYPYHELAARDSATSASLVYAVTAAIMSGVAFFNTAPDTRGIVFSLAIYGASANSPG